MSMNIQTALGLIAEKQDLTTEEMVDVMRQIMSAGSTDVQIGAFLLGMRIKGETIDEITGGVQVLREFASGVMVAGPHLVDIVGTGGDGANLFNVSTAACFVVAAAGGRVAKHGNRSVSSSSGSADVLEAATVDLRDAELPAISRVRVDGGAAANDLLMGIQADLLGAEHLRGHEPIQRPQQLRDPPVVGEVLERLGQPPLVVTALEAVGRRGPLDGDRVHVVGVHGNEAAFHVRSRGPPHSPRKRPGRCWWR